MTVSIALAGKPNCGKSTFFKAATLANVEIANYPFTTIDANHGVAYVRMTCPCREMKTNCGQCRDGFRFVPIGLIDVAGLVPDAHKGRGLGNAFLDNLRTAKAIIHVIDASGGTDIEGVPVPVGSHDPMDDIKFLDHEITMWMSGILKRNWEKLSRKV
ncbi:MAG: 50S ribosome-binding GTPase, partial [Candidatus Methanoperedenaceae archaeon]|nr:50S ribosome-binding GTPase [Candidatus Methanoperedenaceae archaeon]